MWKIFGTVKYHSIKKIKATWKLILWKRKQKIKFLKELLSWNKSQSLLAYPFIKSLKATKSTWKRVKFKLMTKMNLQRSGKAQKRRESQESFQSKISQLQNRRKFTKTTFLFKKLNLKKEVFGKKRAENQDLDDQIYCSDFYYFILIFILWFTKHSYHDEPAWSYFLRLYKLLVTF